MRRGCLGVLLAFAIAPALAAAGTPAGEAWREAETLFQQRRYPEARAVLEKIVAAEPKNAAARHLLGRCWVARNDPEAIAEGTKHLAAAVELEPDNAIYLGIYGGTLLQAASRTTSISAATKGRDAMEKAVKLDPGYLDAREGLFQFYERAPWPIGSSAKAAAHLEEIRKRDPDRATVLSVLSKVRAKDYAAAFALCEAALVKNPDNYAALYQYGRTAFESAQHLDRGLQALQRCLQLEPPTPGSPTHANAWQRIGNIHEKAKRPAEARAAYEAALKLDPFNQQAADGLARVKQGALSPR